MVAKQRNLILGLCLWTMLLCQHGLGQVIIGPAGNLIPEASVPLVFRRSVRKELKLRQSQLEQLKAIQNEFNAFHAELRKRKHAFLQQQAGGLVDDEEQALAEIASFSAENNAKLREQILRVLGAGQRQRFKEILFQYHLSNGHYRLALAVYDMTDLDEFDQAKLRKRERERWAAVELEKARLELASRTDMLADLLPGVTMFELTIALS